MSFVPGQETTPPPAEGVRREWPDLPERVRATVEAWLGSAVLSATTQPGGFSPGAAVRLQTARGARVFLKAVGPEPNPTAAAAHRREAQIVRALPAEAPVPPGLPTLRAFQAAQGVVARRWVARRTGWT